MRYEKFQSNPLDCRKFKARLNAVLDAREDVSHDADLRAHARHCPSCAQWMHALTAVLAAIEETTPIAPAISLAPQHDFALRVLHSVDLERKQQRRWYRWRIASLAIAGGLLIAVLNWGLPDGGNSLTTLPSHPVTTPAPMRQLADLAGDLSSPPMVFVGNVAEGFKPVTTSVNTALQTLLRSVPGNDLPPHVL